MTKNDIKELLNFIDTNNIIKLTDFLDKYLMRKQDGREDQIDRSSYLVGYLHALKIANRVYNKGAKNTNKEN